MEDCWCKGQGDLDGHCTGCHGPPSLLCPAPSHPPPLTTLETLTLKCCQVAPGQMKRHWGRQVRHLHPLIPPCLCSGHPNLSGIRKTTFISHLGNSKAMSWSHYFHTHHPLLVFVYNCQRDLRKTWTGPYHFPAQNCPSFLSQLQWKPCTFWTFSASSVLSPNTFVLPWSHTSLLSICLSNIPGLSLPQGLCTAILSTLPPDLLMAAS